MPSVWYLVVSAIVANLIFGACRKKMRALREEIWYKLHPWEDRWQIRHHRLVIALLAIAMAACVIVVLGLVAIYYLFWTTR